MLKTWILTPQGIKENKTKKMTLSLIIYTFPFAIVSFSFSFYTTNLIISFHFGNNF